MVRDRFGNIFQIAHRLIALHGVDRSVADFDAMYAATPPWDIGRPQPALADLAQAGRITGRVLDVGRGTGEHALMAAGLGLDATGIDAAPRAIALAKTKARDRGLSARFTVGDALDLAALGERFDTVIDSGLFHVFGDDDRARYVASLATAVQGRRPLLPALLQRPPVGGLRSPPGQPGRDPVGLGTRVARRPDRPGDNGCHVHAGRGASVAGLRHADSCRGLLTVRRSADV